VHDLEFYCEDGLGNSESMTDYEIFKVDSTPPTTTKTYLGPYYVDENGWDYIDTASRIKLEAQDGGDICHVDGVATYYRWYRVDDCYCRDDCESPVAIDVIPEFTPYTEPFNITEESCHKIEFYSKDSLDNVEETKYQYVFVDKTAPGIWKEYGEPHFSGIVTPEEGKSFWAEWITSDTPIYAGVSDDGPHKSGIKEVKYRITIVDDNYCKHELVRPEVIDEDGFECDAEGSGEWITVDPSDYEEFEFNIPEESCHLIEIYAEDNVGKNRLHKQCVFVDNTAPTPDKEVGEPKTPWDGLDAEFYDLEEFCQEEGNCWRVTRTTPISLECNDPEPHPVDHEMVCFYIELDGEDYTEEYCDAYIHDYDVRGILKGSNGNIGYNISGDGYCCLDHEISNFLFMEESEHNLKYYCKDALGNKGPIDDEN